MIEYEWQWEREIEKYWETIHWGQVKLQQCIFAGASAASAALRNSGGGVGGGDSPEGGEDTDQGDGISNQLVLR